MGPFYLASLIGTVASLSFCQGFTVHDLQPQPRREFSKLRYNEGGDDAVASIVPPSITGPEPALALGAQALFDKWDTAQTGKLGISQLHQVLSELFPDAIWNERAVARLAAEGMNKCDLPIEFNDFYTWLKHQVQSGSVDKFGARRHVVLHNHVKELEKHFEGSSPPSVVDISYEEIQRIIDVSKPYYALENEGRVIHNDKTIGFVAEINPEMPHRYEGGSIGLAETCRHLAIAGSVAAAMANPKKGKHYYLALDGISRHNEVLPRSLHDGIDALIPRTPGKMRLFAYSIHVGKREATSEAFLFTGDKNDTVMRINVSYKIIPTNLFQRFYPAIEQTYGEPLGLSAPIKTKNPYADEVDISIKEIKSIDNNAMVFTALIPPVCPSKCLGHFDVSPCLPVAFLLGHLVHVAGQSVAHIFDNNGIQAAPSLVAKDGLLKAAMLVQAGTAGLKVEGKTQLVENEIYKVEFNVFYDDKSNDHVAFFEVTCAIE